jgi:hypothetical protein
MSLSDFSSILECRQGRGSIPRSGNNQGGQSSFAEPRQYSFLASTTFHSSPLKANTVHNSIVLIISSNWIESSSLWYQKSSQRSTYTIKQLTKLLQRSCDTSSYANCDGLLTLDPGYLLAYSLNVTVTTLLHRRLG